MIGQVIGNYRIVAELGRGGMGMVYRAEHIQLGRPAALKMLLPQMSSDPAIVQRFFNEARAASAIDHPGIVEVYDFGSHTDGSAYIVMALLKGESLAHRLQTSRVAPLEGASLIVQVLSALAAAHARGIVHRDLKPDNIFLVPNELMAGGTQVKLLDFGIAKLADDKSPGVKTQTGMMIGTPAYMSPEQCMGRSDLDHRTDIYSIGCILFHILCGRPPFLSEHGTGMIIAAQMRDAPPDPRTLNPEIPPPLAAIVLRCLEKEPAARFQNANEVKNALIGAGAHGTLSRPAPSPQESYAATLAVVPTSSGPTAALGTLPTQAGPTAQAGPPPHVGPTAQAGSPPHVGSTAQAGQLTTRSGSAAQMVPMTEHEKSGKGVVIGVGVLLLALGGVGVGVALRGGDDKPAPVATAQLTESANAEPPTPEPSKPEPPTPEPPKPAPVTEPEKPSCPDGMARTVDTNGQCCWPGQAWSSAKTRCIGAPTCPPAMKAKGEQCIAQPAQVVTTQPTTTQPTTQPIAANLSFRLDASAIAPGDSIGIRFRGPMSSKPNNRAWVTVVEADKPMTQYGTWTYVDDGATTAKLVAPKQPGAYEVRLHTEYPAKSTNVVFRAPLTVDSGVAPKVAINVRFHVKTRIVKPGESVELVFAQPMDALPGEKFWVTVTKPDLADDRYGTYDYVPAGARKMSFVMPKEPGDYELRLHANYPTKSTNLVHRVKIKVAAD